MTEQSIPQPHGLYRFFGHSGELLYIGISASPNQRWKAHAGEKPWWNQVRNITIAPKNNRIAALNAERAAIIKERPRYNIIHNRAGDPIDPPLSTGPLTNEWVVTSRYGHSRTIELDLSWEVNGDPMSDDYYPDEISAHGLLNRWLKRYAKPDTNIYWFIGGVHETAPFQTSIKWAHENFLSYYHWPTHAHTGERLNFNKLPVIDKNWSHSGDKGGFIQEATGWKPAPLQPHMHVEQVLAAAGIHAPATWLKEAAA